MCTSGAPSINWLFELRRRNVIRVGVAYLLLGWIVLQSADVLLPLLGVPAP